MSYSILNIIDNYVLHKFGRRMEVNLFDKIQEYAKEKEEFDPYTYLVSTSGADRFDMSITKCESCPYFYMYSMASYAYGDDGNKPRGLL